MRWKINFPDPEKTHKWFAWYPVKMPDGYTVWLETIWRKKIWIGAGTDWFVDTRYAYPTENTLGDHVPKTGTNKGNRNDIDFKG